MTAGRRKESLLEALGRVPDPRGRQGRRYQLASVLAMEVCAMAYGARTWCCQSGGSGAASADKVLDRRSTIALTHKASTFSWLLRQEGTTAATKS